MSAVNMEPDQWQLGRTKVFVKSPESVSGRGGAAVEVHVFKLLQYVHVHVCQSIKCHLFYLFNTSKHM